MLLLAGFTCGFVAASDTSPAPATANSWGPSFAIADFDGDFHPDLASVEVSSTDSRQTIYSIRLQLTAGGRRAIRVAAPSGGLQILARDVNGDNAIDLVLATAADGEPVAVFLNDGHGGFKQVDQAAFPGAFGNPSSALATKDEPFVAAADGPPSPRSGVSGASSALTGRPSEMSAAALSCSDCLLDTSLIFRLGRAPPHRSPRL